MRGLESHKLRFKSNNCLSLLLLIGGFKEDTMTINREFLNLSNCDQISLSQKMGKQKHKFHTFKHRGTLLHLLHYLGTYDPHHQARWLLHGVVGMRLFPMDREAGWTNFAPWGLRWTWKNVLFVLTPIIHTFQILFMIFLKTRDQFPFIL